MTSIRFIPRLDIKNNFLIKGINLEGLRKIGDPNTFAKQYYLDGADEILFIDCVASLYGRNSLEDIIKKIAKKVFIPITVGGGIRSIDDATRIMRSGADKVAINTAAIKTPKLITEIARIFGSQAMVLSIEAKKISENKWEAYTDNGRERTGQDVFEWIKYGVSLGAGELLITSVDHEGTRLGFDNELIKHVCSFTNVPVIASGGMGNLEHFNDLVRLTEVSGVAMADVLHYERLSITNIREYGIASGFNLRDF